MLELGQKIIELMEQKGVTLDQLARDTKVSTRSIRRILQNTQFPSEKLLQRIANSIGTKPEIEFVPLSGKPEGSGTIHVIESARSYIKIVGINCLRPLHQYFQELSRLVKQGGSMKVILLDPFSNAFHKRENQVSGTVPSYRLRGEFLASLGLLQDIGKQGKVEVRLTQEFLKFLRIITDRSALQNPYPLHGPISVLSQHHIVGSAPNLSKSEMESLFGKIWVKSRVLQLNSELFRKVGIWYLAPLIQKF